MKIDLSNYQSGNSRNVQLATSVREIENEIVEDLLHLLELKNRADFVRYCINSTIQNDPNVIEKFCKFDNMEEVYPMLYLALSEYYEMDEELLIEEDDE